MPGTYRKRIYMSLVHTDSFRQTLICAHSTLRVKRSQLESYRQPDIYIYTSKFYMYVIPIIYCNYVYILYTYVYVYNYVI